MKKKTPAQQLLQKIRPHHGQRPIRRSAIDCLTAFNEHLKWLRDRHLKKSWSDEYIISVAFRKSRKLESAAEEMAYCRVHLKLAVDFFQAMYDEINSNKKKPVAKNLNKYSELITDFIFDLMPIATYLEQKKDPNYEFLRGGKFYGVESFQIFNLSVDLSANSKLSENHPRLDHKTSQIASVFLLRQALEAKFERIVAVSLQDRKGDTPRLKHNFHYDFVKSNIHLYEFNNTNFTSLKTIYEWCSTVVHRPYQPLAWQISYAHHICGPLWHSGPLNRHGGYSVYGGVRILNIDSLRSEFINHFNSSYDHGIWCVNNYAPEAVTDFYN